MARSPGPTKGWQDLPFMEQSLLPVPPGWQLLWDRPDCPLPLGQVPSAVVIPVTSTEQALRGG